jgi:two-component system nitrogen regulation sensor histidine kinase GlnL
MMDTAVIQLDNEGRILTMNTAAEHCLYVGRERAVGRILTEVANIPAAMHETLQQPGEVGSGVRLHQLRLAGGQYDCTLQTDAQGFVLLELHDLEWEHKRIQLEHREMQTGLLELLSRNLGHEIRNPLGGIRGASQMLANELDSPELVTLARLIMREADRIDELIQSFCQPQLAQDEFDFYPLLDEVLALAGIEFGRQARIERDFDPSIPSIRGDATAIRQVLLNLIRNAFQAGAQQITVKTRVEHGGALLQAGASSLLRIDVDDDGEGVPESLRNLLFLPLVTGKRSGTGLGLALSQQIAAAHGGLLAYEPLGAEGGGSRFSFYLPLEKSRIAEAAECCS